MLDKIKKLFLKKQPEPISKKNEDIEQKPAQTKKKKELSDKEKATANNEPYIAILKVEINPENVNDGAFELDWNEKFVLNLIRAGYKIRNDDTDEIIVDRWFQTICRNIAMELYDQNVADPDKRDVRYQLQTKKLDNNRREIG